MEDELAILCPARARGFSLTDKTWAFFLVDKATEIEWRADAVSRLAIADWTVFLRQIEHYGGIIFLTTNRLKEFDPSFESRIQFKASFDPLTAAQRAKICSNLVLDWVMSTKEKSQENAADWSTEVFTRLGEKYDFNGRQIRNMIKNGIALARMENKPLSETHLVGVAEANQSWVLKTDLE
ncbi:hypothetical protein PG984_004697 [Apiospora sp. TS-2023a]